MAYGWVGIGILAFASTNIDDIFVLIGFLSQSEVRTWQVVLGQYLGLGFIIGFSLAGSFVTLLIPQRWVGLLGIVPVLMGLIRLWLRRRAQPAEAAAPAGNFLPHAPNAVRATGATLGEKRKQRRLSYRSFLALSHCRGLKHVVAVALVTVSNGSDNVATYVPLFASATSGVKQMLVALFLLMIALWCALGNLMVSHRLWGEKVRCVGTLLLPYVLIVLGSLILWRSFHQGHL